MGYELNCRDQATRKETQKRENVSIFVCPGLGYSVAVTDQGVTETETRLESQVGIDLLHQCVVDPYSMIKK